MKRIILLTSTLILICFGFTFAQEKVSVSIPSEVKNKFIQLYPHVTDAKWSKEGNEYEVEFTEGTKKMGATFTSKGEFLEKEVILKVTDLPTLAQQYLNTNYPGQKITEVADVTNAKNHRFFEVETSGKKLYFDPSGKFLNAKAEDEDEEEDD